MANQWDKTTRIIILGICLVLTGGFIYLIQPMIGPFIVAALLAYILNPIVKAVQTRTRLSRIWAVSLVYFSSLALLIIVPSVFAPTAIEQTRGLYDDLVKIELQLEDMLAKPVYIMGQQLHLGPTLAEMLKTTSQSLIPTAEGAMVVIHTTSASLVWLLVILISFIICCWMGHLY